MAFVRKTLDQKIKTKRVSNKPIRMQKILNTHLHCDGAAQRRSDACQAKGGTVMSLFKLKWLARAVVVRQWLS